MSTLTEAFEVSVCSDVNVSRRDFQVSILASNQASRIVWRLQHLESMEVSGKSHFHLLRREDNSYLSNSYVTGTRNYFVHMLLFNALYFVVAGPEENITWPSLEFIANCCQNFDRIRHFPTRHVYILPKGIDIIKNWVRIRVRARALNWSNRTS